jgi:histone H3
MARMKATPVHGGAKPPRRVLVPPKFVAVRVPRPGTHILREIRKYQTTTQLLLPRAPCLRLMREIALRLAPGIRFQHSAVEALREAAETHLVRRFKNADAAAQHTGRVTVMVHDLDLVRRIVRE